MPKVNHRRVVILSAAVLGAAKDLGLRVVSLVESNGFRCSRSFTARGYPPFRMTLGCGRGAWSFELGHSLVIGHCVIAHSVPARRLSPTGAAAKTKKAGLRPPEPSPSEGKLLFIKRGLPRLTRHADKMAAPSRTAPSAAEHPWVRQLLPLVDRERFRVRAASPHAKAPTLTARLQTKTVPDHAFAFGHRVSASRITSLDTRDRKIACHGRTPSAHLD
jgi:hypothetical protein